MDHDDAQRVTTDIDMSTPWKCRSDFMRALAAVSCIYQEDMNRRLHHKKRRVWLCVWVTRQGGVVRGYQ